MWCVCILCNWCLFPFFLHVDRATSIHQLCHLWQLLRCVARSRTWRSLLRWRLDASVASSSPRFSASKVRRNSARTHRAETQSPSKGNSICLTHSSLFIHSFFHLHLHSSFSCIFIFIHVPSSFFIPLRSVCIHVRSTQEERFAKRFRLAAMETAAFMALVFVPSELFRLR